MDKIINRFSSYQIIELLTHYPAVGIIGPRQCGKTTLAKQIAKQIEKEVLYLDLEFADDISKLSNPSLFLKQHENKCVIIDEIQVMPELFSLLRSLIDQKREAARFIILGSASPEITRNSSESLAGRISYLELSPFTLTEINQIFGIENHWLKGGFPVSLQSKNINLSYRWRNDFIRSYTERDLPLLGLNQDSSVLLNFLQLIASYHANIWNNEGFSRSIGLNRHTVLKYLNFLEKAFIIRKLNAFSLNIGKRIIKSPKVYIRDSGLLHNLVKIKTKDDLISNYLVGASWEGYVVEQICYQLKDEFDIYFYRTHQGSECDLVLAKGGKAIISIEIKYSSSPKLTRGFYEAIKDLNTQKNYVIAIVDEPYAVDHNIKVTNIESLLNELKQAL